MMNTNLQIAPDHLLQEQKAEQLGRQAAARGKQLTDTERNKLKKISQDFEALFVGMMLKSMRDTVPEDKLTGGGRAEETYRSLLDQEYATQAARRGGANSISAMVEKELLKQYAVPAKKVPGAE